MLQSFKVITTDTSAYKVAFKTLTLTFLGLIFPDTNGDNIDYSVL